MLTLMKQIVHIACGFGNLPSLFEMFEFYFFSSWGNCTSSAVLDYCPDKYHTLHMLGYRRSKALGSHM